MIMAIPRHMTTKMVLVPVELLRRGEDVAIAYYFFVFIAAALRRVDLSSEFIELDGFTPVLLAVSCAKRAKRARKQKVN
jgi:hypothetical protein